MVGNNAMFFFGGGLVFFLLKLKGDGIYEG